MEIENTIQFITEVLREAGDGRMQIYRGQADASWPLKANVFRDNYSEHKEKNIYEIVKKYNFKEFDKQDFFIDELIRMQHYGIPTRLLDWSYNPLIALYFAVSSEKEKNEDGMVYQASLEKSRICSFNSAEFKSISALLQADAGQSVISFNNFEDENTIKEVLLGVIENSRNTFFIDSVLDNNRIRMQQGCFSVTIDKKPKFIKYMSSELVDLFIRKFFTADDIELGFKKDLEIAVQKKCFEGIKRLVKNNIYEEIDDDINRKSFITEVNRIYVDERLKEELKGKKTDFNIVERSSEVFVGLIKEFVNTLKTDSYIIEGEDISKFLIKKEFKQNIKKELEKIGINSTFVYPDIQGSVDYFKELY